MYTVWTQLIATLVIVTLGGGVYTTAYFHDVEAQTGNFLGASKLDLVVTGDGFSDRLCGIGDKETTELRLINHGVVAFTVEMSAEALDGALCDELTIRVRGDDGLLYNGPVTELAIEPIALSPHASSSLELRVRVPYSTDLPDGAACTFDTVFAAAQQGFNHGEAFYDLERVSHSIILDRPAPPGDVTVINDNHATVTNSVTVSASTGGNSANGGSGGDGGAGGDNESGTGGDGAAGGAGGSGGTVNTGPANASVSISTVVNTNETVIETCGCGCAEECDEAPETESATASHSTYKSSDEAVSRAVTDRTTTREARRASSTTDRQ